MRILLVVFVFLLTGCYFTQSRTLLSAEPKISTKSKIIKSIFGFTNVEIKTPDLIPSNVLPDSGVYYISTRVVIEGQPIETMHKGKMVEGMWWARTPKDVRRDLDNTEKIYEKIGVKFHVKEVIFKEMNPNMLDHFIDANVHPGEMTLVYMLPNMFQWDGYSSAPWEMVNRGIIIHYLADEWTAAHEIGHYFGLLHPFAEDYVDDTPEQTVKYCTGKEHSTPNCHNIMGYCDHTPKHATPQQLERFKRFLRAKRIDHCVREYTDVLLRGHRFPTPSETNIIFNIDIDG